MPVSGYFVARFISAALYYDVCVKFLFNPVMGCCYLVKYLSQSLAD